MAVGAVAEGTRRLWGSSGVNNACMVAPDTRGGVTFLGAT